MPRIEDLVADVLNCLQVVNVHYNGSKPSEVIERDRDPKILEAVCCAVNGIIVGALRDYRKSRDDSYLTSHERDSLLRGIGLIAGAWDQVLAGDIDDVREDLTFELD